MTDAIVKSDPSAAGPQAIVGPYSLHHLAIRPDWLDAKRNELMNAENALAALRQVAPDARRTGTVAERVSMLRKALVAMESGYVPIPRFDSVRLDLEMEVLPSHALVALAEAEEARVFNEVRFVRGRESESNRGPYRRVPARDPLLRGVIRTPEHRERRTNHDGSQSWMALVTPSREAHFLIAWWQPSDERDEDMF